MGLFVAPTGTNKKKLAQQAIANLNLYLEEKDGEYLIDFAISCLNKMKEIDDGTAKNK